METIRVSECFTSIQGESHWAGYPCAFVRLAGCNLDCGYCDTRYAREEEGRVKSVADVAAWVAGTGLKTVEVTGGEPLAQPGTLSLLTRLSGQGLRVLLETNGSLPIEGVARRVHVILDVKTPGSGMADRMCWENLKGLKRSDEVKFVLCGRSDYEWAKGVIAEHGLTRRVRVNLSPVHGLLAPGDLARWMVEDRLDARFQLQLHRLLWPGSDRGV